MSVIIPSTLLLVLAQNKHELTSHPSRNRSISVSTAGKTLLKQLVIKMSCSISFISGISVYSSLFATEMKSSEEHFAKY